jgi:predicted TIM-barrel enzyme
MDNNYAKGKLKLVLRDIGNYNDGEFWRELSRIAYGLTTRQPNAEELLKERDELKAHCEVLNSALIKALTFMARETCGIEDEQQQKRIQDAVRNYKKALEQTPTQSLLFHDANVIELAVSIYGGNQTGEDTDKDLLTYAERLRKQAKEK